MPHGLGSVPQVLQHTARHLSQSLQKFNQAHPDVCKHTQTTHGHSNAVVHSTSWSPFVLNDKNLSCTVSRFPHLIHLKLITYATYAKAWKFKKEMTQLTSTDILPTPLPVGSCQSPARQALADFQPPQSQYRGQQEFVYKAVTTLMSGWIFQLICNLSGTSALGSFFLVSTACSATLSHYTLSSIKLMGRREQGQE